MFWVIVSMWDRVEITLPVPVPMILGIKTSGVPFWRLGLELPLGLYGTCLYSLLDFQGAEHARNYIFYIHDSGSICLSLPTKAGGRWRLRQNNIKRNSRCR